MEKTQHKRAITAWTMYDWANSSFATTISAAVLPVYYANVAAVTLPENLRSAYWAYTTTISLLLVALLGPILGAMADFSGAKKRFLTFFVILGASATGLLFLVDKGNYTLASGLYILAALGFSGSIVFYDSLLPHVARPDEIDQVSTRGYAMGYLGGGILLAINLAMIQLTQGDTRILMTKLSFVSVAIWWLVFTIPLWRWVPEPPKRRLANDKSDSPLTASVGRLGHTFRAIRKYRQLFKFLIAFWLYNNGIGTIIFMASIYGKELGFSDITVIGTLLMVQFVAIPFSFLFGWLAKRLGTKPSIYVSLIMYTVIAILGYFLAQEWQFWLLGALVATVQGGSQALSRSLFGRMLPKSQSAEFYSFFGVSEKIAGAIGPLVFGLATQYLGGGRMGIISLIIFFVLGGGMLTTVNEKEGIQVAEQEEALAI
jgi:MFS transporter, UMF1 family